MHENRHFLSCWNVAMTLKIMCTCVHYVTLGSCCKMASKHALNEKIPVWISKDEALTPLSVAGPLFISSFSSLVAFQSFFVLFTLAFTTGWTSSGSLPFIGCFIFPIYPCFFHHMQKLKRFLRSNLIDKQFHGLSVLGFGVGLVTGSCHLLFFLLACPFVFWVILFIYDVRGRGVVSMFNETSHSFFV